MLDPVPAVVEKPAKLTHLAFYGPWSDRPIRDMIYWTEKYVVYVNNKSEIDFEMKDSLKHDDVKELNRILNEAVLLESSVPGELPIDIQLHCKRLIGEGISCAIESDYDNARSMLQSAATYIQARSREISRVWYLTASVLAATIILTAGSLAWIFRPAVEPVVGKIIFWLLLGGTAGAFGALFSVIIRKGHTEFDCSSGRRVHFVEGSSRIVAGAISGVIVTLGIESGLFFSLLGQVPKYYIVLMVAALIGGAGERLASSMISDVNALGLKGLDTRRPIERAQKETEATKSITTP